MQYRRLPLTPQGCTDTFATGSVVNQNENLVQKLNTKLSESSTSCVEQDALDQRSDTVHQPNMGLAAVLMRNMSRRVISGFLANWFWCICVAGSDFLRVVVRVVGRQQVDDALVIGKAF